MADSPKVRIRRTITVRRLQFASPGCRLDTVTRVDDILAVNNFGRIFSEIVSADAWHSSFAEADQIAMVHADVSFMQAKLGAESDCPVRFSLSLKRAEVSFYIPPREPLAVVQSSIARQIGPVGQRTLEITSGRSMDVAANAKLSASVSPSLAGSIDATSKESSSSKDITSLTEKIGPFTVRHFLRDGSQCWEIIANTGSVLLGKAWDPVLEPRLRMKKTASSKLEPIARLRVRCKKEDLAVSGLMFKSPRLLDRMGWQADKNKEAAASAYIKARLVENDLTPANFDEDYSVVFLADVPITEEVA